MHISILTGVQKGYICRLKNGHILRKNDVHLKLNFQSEGHLYAYFFIYILTTLIFIVNVFFSNCSEVAYECTFSSYQWSKKDTLAGKKNCHNLLKNVLLKLNIQDEGHLYVNCFFIFYLLYMTSVSVLTFWHTYTHFRPISGLKSTHYHRKMVIFC